MADPHTPGNLGPAQDARTGSPPVSEAAREAIARLMDDHGGQLYAMASRLCGSPDQAEDLVQEVFLRALRGWAQFRGEADPKTWLFRIAANACQRMHRRASGEPEAIASLDAPLPFGEPLIALVASDQPDAVRARIHAEALERLEAEFARLPEAFRVPLLLKDLVGLGVAQVAAILGLEEGTVRSRVHRARLKLRAAVDAALPRDAKPAPPPAYDERTCLDLLAAKQEALDRGAAFESAIICQRCRSVFASLDLAQEICRELGAGRMPADLRARLGERVAAVEGRPG